jgi:hypothetical protein
MSNNTYNGWTNYATWRVNLEMFDGFDPADWNDDWQDNKTVRADLADYLKETAIQVVEDGCSDKGGFALDYALAFLDDVNWFEIASNKVAEYK